MRTAQARVAPASIEAVSDILATCDRSGEKVLIVGGNTLEGMGFPAERVDLTISTTHLVGVVANERADLTIAVRAGTPLQNIATLLAGQQQILPFDAPQPQNATVGGTMAAGWLGPRRHLYGRIRDYVIGATAVLADGTVARAGGMVVKNVAGYDLSRLYLGSFGTLAIIAQANFKTAPMPAQSRLFYAPLPERTQHRACEQVAALAIAPAAAFWIKGFHKNIDGEDGSEGRIAVLLEGSDAVLERATRDLRSALGRAGVPETLILDAGARESFQRVIDAYIACVGERSITYRLYALPHCCVDIALRLQEVAAYSVLRSDTLVDVMNGDVVLRVSDLSARAFGEKIENFDETLQEAGPRVQIIAGKHVRRASLPVWGKLPAGIEEMRSLKTRFDPNRTLNPGRFVGGI